jgi:hypothetical protein
MLIEIKCWIDFSISLHATVEILPFDLNRVSSPRNCRDYSLKPSKTTMSVKTLPQKIQT